MSHQTSDLKTLFSCIDHTSLNATDTEASIERFCANALEMCDSVGTKLAAVCVYPAFVGVAAKTLKGSGISVASVACGFPAGQIPLRLKIDEVKYVIDQGADEVDMVITRGDILEGNMIKVFDDIAAVREYCFNQKLKVIIETGELQTEANITAASQTAIAAGADFIKTSTGKISVGATIEAAEIMLKVLTNNIEISKRTIGFKASGGISTVEQAMEYADLTRLLLGEQCFNKQYFRIGASRLTSKVYELLRQKN